MTAHVLTDPDEWISEQLYDSDKTYRSNLDLYATHLAEGGDSSEKIKKVS